MRALQGIRMSRSRVWPEVSPRKSLGAAAALVALVVLLGAGSIGLTGCGDDGFSLERVQLDSGPITGVQEGDMWVFRGIPYADPPVGDLRWRAPQPVTPWTDERACIAFGPACPQPSQAETFYLTVGETGEDCLYLNVWSPAAAVETGEG